MTCANSPTNTHPVLVCTQNMCAREQQRVRGGERVREREREEEEGGSGRAGGGETHRICLWEILARRTGQHCPTHPLYFSLPPLCPAPPPPSPPPPFLPPLALASVSHIPTAPTGQIRVWSPPHPPSPPPIRINLKEPRNATKSSSLTPEELRRENFRKGGAPVQRYTLSTFFF